MPTMIPNTHSSINFQKSSQKNKKNEEVENSSASTHPNQWEKFFKLSKCAKFHAIATKTLKIEKQGLFSERGGFAVDWDIKSAPSKWSKSTVCNWCNWCFYRKNGKNGRKCLRKTWKWRYWQKGRFLCPSARKPPSLYWAYWKGQIFTSRLTFLLIQLTK